MVRFTDRPDMILDVYRGRKTTMQLQQCMPTRDKSFSYRRQLSAVREPYTVSLHTVLITCFRVYGTPQRLASIVLKETTFVTSCLLGVPVAQWVKCWPTEFEPRSRRNHLNRKRDCIANSRSLSSTHRPDNTVEKDVNSQVIQPSILFASLADIALKMRSPLKR